MQAYFWQKRNQSSDLFMNNEYKLINANDTNFKTVNKNKSFKMGFQYHHSHSILTGLLGLSFTSVWKLTLFLTEQNLISSISKRLKNLIKYSF